MNQSNCMVAQSGGPTAAINASLAGVISGIKKSGKYDTCYGAINGILGILNERYLNLSQMIPDEKTLNRLKVTPAMYLGSCRHKLPDYKDDDSAYVFIFNQFAKLNIKAFFYIGGNDSMDTVLKLSDYAAKIKSDIRIIGVPKTIDNDLCMIDHTPGFGSAAKYIASTMLEIAHDTFIYAVKSVTIVEIMGRDAGWLTAASALARKFEHDNPVLIYLPETDFDQDAFIEKVRTSLETTPNLVVCISEGIHDNTGTFIRDKNGDYITASKAVADQFGHQQLSGAGKALEFLVKENIGVKVRSIEINVLQRCASHLASATDQSEAFALGEHAVLLAEEGVTASMVTLTRTSNTPYAVAYDHAPIRGIANEAKSIPREWINAHGNDIRQELYNYLYPLIQGEVSLTYQNGVPVYMPVPHLKPDHIS